MRVLFLGDVGVIRDRPEAVPWPPPIPGDADTRIILNWELPVGSVSERYKTMQLTAPPSAIRAIGGWPGVVASLANNHALDAGAEGLLATVSALKAAGMESFGYRQLGVGDFHAWRWEHPDGRLCVLPWVTPETTPIPRSLDGIGPAIWPGLEHAASIVREAKSTHDWVVIYIHWDIEFFTSPSPDTRAIARGLVEAGADLIIGHHPHVVRGREVVNSAHVFYSLGNYYFDDLPPDARGIARRQVRQSRESIGVLASFRQNQEPEIEILSFIQDRGQAPRRDLNCRGSRRLEVASRILRECSGEAYARWYRSALRWFMSLEYRLRFRVLSLTGASALKLLRWRLSRLFK